MESAERVGFVTEWGSSMRSSASVIGSATTRLVRLTFRKTVTFVVAIATLAGVGVPPVQLRTMSPIISEELSARTTGGTPAFALQIIAGCALATTGILKISTTRANTRAPSAGSMRTKYPPRFEKNYEGGSILAGVIDVNVLFAAFAL